MLPGKIVHRCFFCIFFSYQTENSPLTAKKKRVIFSEPVVSNELVFDRSSSILLSSNSTNAGKQQQPTIGVKRSRSDLSAFSIESIIDDDNNQSFIVDQDKDMEKTSHHSNIDSVKVDLTSNSILNKQNSNDTNNNGTSKRRKLQHQKATLEYNDDIGEYSGQQSSSNDDYLQNMLNSLSKNCSTIQTNFDSKTDWINNHENDDNNNDDDNYDESDDEDFYFTTTKFDNQQQLNFEVIII